MWVWVWVCGGGGTTAGPNICRAAYLVGCMRFRGGGGHGWYAPSAMGEMCSVHTRSSRGCERCDDGLPGREAPQDRRVTLRGDHRMACANVCLANPGGSGDETSCAPNVHLESSSLSEDAVGHRTQPLSGHLRVGAAQGGCIRCSKLHHALWNHALAPLRVRAGPLDVHC